MSCYSDFEDKERWVPEGDGDVDLDIADTDIDDVDDVDDEEEWNGQMECRLLESGELDCRQVIEGAMAERCYDDETTNERRCRFSFSDFGTIIPEIDGWLEVKIFLKADPANPIWRFRVYSPVTLVGYDNDNETEISPQLEKEKGIYVMVNKMLDSNGSKVNKNFQEEDGEELDLPAEARKIELRMLAPVDNDPANATYTVKFKLESDDGTAAEKVAIWQVPEDAGIDEQKKWEIKVGGTESGDPGMEPADPVMTITEGEEEKTMTFWLEGRKPVTDINTPVYLVAEIFKGSEEEPKARDMLKLNPVEVTYLMPLVSQSSRDPGDIPDVETDIEVCNEDSQGPGWCELLAEQIRAVPGSMLETYAWAYDPSCGFEDSAVGRTENSRCQTLEDGTQLYHKPIDIHRLQSEAGGKGIFRVRVVGFEKQELDKWSISGQDTNTSIAFDNATTTVIGGNMLFFTAYEGDDSMVLTSNETFAYYFGEDISIEKQRRIDEIFTEENPGDNDGLRYLHNQTIVNSFTPHDQAEDLENQEDTKNVRIIGHHYRYAFAESGPDDLENSKFVEIPIPEQEQWQDECPSSLDTYQCGMYVIENSDYDRLFAMNTYDPDCKTVPLHPDNTEEARSAYSQARETAENDLRKIIVKISKVGDVEMVVTGQGEIRLYGDKHGVDEYWDGTGIFHIPEGNVPDDGLELWVEGKTASGQGGAMVLEVTQTATSGSDLNDKMTIVVVELKRETFTIGDSDIEERYYASLAGKNLAHNLKVDSPDSVDAYGVDITCDPGQHELGICRFYSDYTKFGDLVVINREKNLAWNFKSGLGSGESFCLALRIPNAVVIPDGHSNSGLGFSFAKEREKCTGGQCSFDELVLVAPFTPGNTDRNHVQITRAVAMDFLSSNPTGSVIGGVSNYGQDKFDPPIKLREVFWEYDKYRFNYSSIDRIIQQQTRRCDGLYDDWICGMHKEYKWHFCDDYIYSWFDVENDGGEYCRIVNSGEHYRKIILGIEHTLQSISEENNHYIPEDLAYDLVILESCSSGKNFSEGLVRDNMIYSYTNITLQWGVIGYYYMGIYDADDNGYTGMAFSRHVLDYLGEESGDNDFEYDRRSIRGSE